MDVFIFFLIWFLVSIVLAVIYRIFLVDPHSYDSTEERTALFMISFWPIILMFLPLFAIGSLLAFIINYKRNL